MTKAIQNETVTNGRLVIALLEELQGPMEEDVFEPWTIERAKAEFDAAKLESIELSLLELTCHCPGCKPDRWLEHFDAAYVARLANEYEDSAAEVAVIN